MGRCSSLWGRPGPSQSPVLGSSDLLVTLDAGTSLTGPASPDTPRIGRWEQVLVSSGPHHLTLVREGPYTQSRAAQGERQEGGDPKGPVGVDWSWGHLAWSWLKADRQGGSQRSRQAEGVDSPSDGLRHESTGPSVTPSLPLKRYLCVTKPRVPTSVCVGPLGSQA